MAVSWHSWQTYERSNDGAKDQSDNICPYGHVDVSGTYSHDTEHKREEHDASKPPPRCWLVVLHHVCVVRVDFLHVLFANTLEPLDEVWAPEEDDVSEHASDLESVRLWRNLTAMLLLICIQTYEPAITGRPTRPRVLRLRIPFSNIFWTVYRVPSLLSRLALMNGRSRLFHAFE